VLSVATCRAKLGSHIQVADDELIFLRDQLYGLADLAIRSGDAPRSDGAQGVPHA